MIKKELQIPFLEISSSLERDGVPVEITELNWPEFAYKPDVSLLCAYTSDEILLKYRVRESHVRGINTAVNSEVYKDSCVEFFISIDAEVFYNFEFNCIGTAYCAYGTRENRTLLDEKLVSGIRTSSTLGSTALEERKMEGEWELSVAIPLNTFKEKELQNPGDKTFFANFYKCGDELPRPHYLSWNPIDTGKPDFHQPDYFGIVHFSKHP